MSDPIDITQQSRIEQFKNGVGRANQGNHASPCAMLRHWQVVSIWMS